MKRDPCINAVLNDWQLEVFCQRFGLQPSEIEVCTDGWFKNVLLARDRAYLFPRDPRGIRALNREVAVYRAFRAIDDDCYPRLIERVIDKNISYYEFAVVTRLNGLSFRKESGLDELRAGKPHELDPDKLARFLVSLVRQVAKWHELPTSGMDLKPAKTKESKLSIRNWSRQLLIPNRTENSVRFLSGLVLRRLGITLSVPRLTELFINVARLKPVLVHGDVHEDQLLVASPISSEISGVLDWETARIDNPVWDFDFGEWGLEIWAYYKHLAQLRNRMWKEYLRCRNLGMPSFDGLDAYYTFQELLHVISNPSETHFAYTGKGYSDTLQFYLSKIKGMHAVR